MCSNPDACCKTACFPNRLLSTISSVLHITSESHGVSGWCVIKCSLSSFSFVVLVAGAGGFIYRERGSRYTPNLLICNQANPHVSLLWPGTPHVDFINKSYQSCVSTLTKGNQGQQNDNHMTWHMAFMYFNASYGVM
jgi:hypothetical protein